MSQISFLKNGGNIKLVKWIRWIIRKFEFIIVKRKVTAEYFVLKIEIKINDKRIQLFLLISMAELPLG